MNPFDAIAEKPIEENPFNALSSGISTEAPKDINPFDVIGYTPPEQVKPEMLEGAKPGILEKHWPFGTVQDPETRAAVAAETVKDVGVPERTIKESLPGETLERPTFGGYKGGMEAQGAGEPIELPPSPIKYQGMDVFKEKGTGNLYIKTPEGFTSLSAQEEADVKKSDEYNLDQWDTVPWIDPVTVGLTAGGMATGLAVKSGASIAEAVGRGAVSAGISAAAEYPIGMVTEKVAEKHPELAPYVNIGLGILSGATVENFIQKAIIGKGLTPTTRAVNKYIAELKAGVISDDVAETVAKNIQDEIKVKHPNVDEELAARQKAHRDDLRKDISDFEKQKAFIPPKEKKYASYIEEVKDRFPGADEDDISYIAREISDDFSGMKDPRSRSNAEAWKRFSETGMEEGARGGKKSFEFGKQRFEKKLRDYLEFKNSVNELSSKETDIPTKLADAVEPGHADEMMATVKKFAKTEEEQINSIVDDSVKQHVDMAKMAAKRHPDIAEKEMNIAMENGQKLKLADGPKTEAAVDAALAGDVQAGSLAYGMELPKYAGSINLERIDADYTTKKLILDTSDQYKGKIDAARRGTITHEATREMADKLGMTEKQLLRRRKGRAFNAEEALAARDILNTSAQNLAALQKKAVEDGSDEMLTIFREALERHAAIQAEVSGVATEAGRALSSHRIASMKNARVAKNYKKMLEAIGGRDKNEKIIEYFRTIDPENQTAVNRFVMDATKATTSDKLFEVWINAMLSGPTTHVVNATSNTLTFLSYLPEKATGATLDLLRAGTTGKPKERFFGELPHHVYGSWQGIKEGVRAGLKSFMTEIPSDDASKFEVGRQMAIKGKLGRTVRLPGRALMASDEFFKAINYSAEIHSLAYRQAVKEGHKGAARAKRIAEIINNPSEELISKGKGEMLYRVFQKDLGPTGQAMTLLRGKTPGLKYIIPFLKTPTNIAKFGLERTPLNYPRIFRKMMKGELKGGEISDEMAKATMGSLIGLATFMYAKEGSITGGGPKNKQDRDALYSTGWQPYSFKRDDGTYVSYGRLEPLGMIIGLTADASDIWDEMNKEDRENVAAMIALSVSKNLTSKTFLKGISDAINAASDPARYGEKWAQSLASTVVPTVSGTTARAIDPTIREAQSFLDSIKAKIPYKSKELFPKRDKWGQPIERDLRGPAAMVSPIYISHEKGSKSDKEIVRLGVRIGKPSKKLRGQELTPEQYDSLLVMGGEEAKKRVDKFVSSRSYAKMDDEFKAKMIKNRYDSAMDLARIKLWSEIRKEKK